MDYIICHYHEIALKEKNRKFFEGKLIKNIKNQINPIFWKSIQRISGRIIIKLSSQGIKKQSSITASLQKIAGIAYFAFSTNSEQTILAIKNQALKILKQQKFQTFKILTKRSKKNFFLTSPEINQEIGAFIINKLNKRVDLKQPEITYFIEIVENFAFSYLKKIKGLGGLPVSTSGKAIVLLSGGIDSPVAVFYGLKRGIQTVFVHFHAYPYANKQSIEKVEKIVKIFKQYQSIAKLYLVPFADIQKQILIYTPANLRIILYRRMMLRIAERIAQKEKALSLITGESLGQVASQTLENIKTIEDSVDILILRPLIGMDKEEIINKAKEIGTYKLSILPDQDCCSRFLPKSPKTKAKIKEVRIAEEKLNIIKLISETIKTTTIKKV